MEYDEGGGLSAVTTPRGHKYSFLLQPSILHNRFMFTPPGTPRHPYQLLYTDDGKLLAQVLPQQAGRVVYKYDDAGRLQHQIFGHGSIEYGYYTETGLLRYVTLRELGYEQRIDNKYHAGLIKEQRIRYGPAVGQSAARMMFMYDGNARPRRVDIEIDGKKILNYETKYDMTLGTLDSIADLKMSTSFHNRTVIQDARKTMLRVTSYDVYGRLVESSMTLRSRLVHRSKYSYDSLGRLASKSTWRGPGTQEYLFNYTYTPDGFLQNVDGSENWQFRYDDNGNMIAVVEGGREITATYDASDRLLSWGDMELNTYDSAGRVVQQGETQFAFTAKGNIRHAWQQKKGKHVTYRYDYKGRLTALEDKQGNITQFFYADIKRPNLPTHIHYPKSGFTHNLLYDERGHLLALQTETGRLWVSSDHMGSPLAVFDSSGIMIKEITRSPWGETLKDTNPSIKLYVDFHGGIRDPVFGLVMFGLYAYDPMHCQWLSPRFDQIPSVPQHVPAIYMHRYSNNNPVNPPLMKGRHNTGNY